MREPVYSKVETKRLKTPVERLHKPLLFQSRRLDKGLIHLYYHAFVAISQTNAQLFLI